MATAALFAIVLVLFAPTLASYHGVWSAQPYTHGYLIAAACVWLVWQKRAVLKNRTAGWRALLLPAAGLSLLWLAASAANVRLILEAVLPIGLLCWCGAAFGRQAALRLAPVAATFMLAVPIWGVLTGPLRSLTIGVTGAALSLLHVPAEMDGDTVHIASGSFVIEDGCAGLSYLMSGLTVGALYAQTLVSGWRNRLAILGLATVIPIVGNWIRVTSLIVIGERTAMESMFVTEPRPHIVFGWSIFLVGLVVFFLLAGRVARRDTPRVAPEPLVSAPDGWHMQSALLATLALGIGPLLYYGLAAVPSRDVAPPRVGEFPLQWEPADAQRPRPYAWTPAFLGASAHFSARWTGESGPVLIDRLVYRSQEQGAELIGYGSQIAPEGTVLAERLMGVHGGARLVNEAVVLDRASSLPVLVWYWYRVGGIETVAPARAKLLEIWAFLSRTRVSELIAVSSACAPADCAEASRALAEMFGSERAASSVAPASTAF